jgi:hypothetical protein
MAGLRLPILCVDFLKLATPIVVVHGGPPRLKMRRAISVEFSNPDVGRVWGVPAAVATLALASICREVAAALARLFNVAIKAMSLFRCHFLSPSRPASPTV